MTLKELALVPHKLIIWAGAGVSVRTPCRLPLARTMVSHALETACGSSASREILAIWANANSIASTHVQPEPFGPVPRLEVILGVIDEVEKNSKIKYLEYMGGLRSFSSAPFNANHIYLAYLLKAGATVVTPNFDFCIQNAYHSVIAPYDRLEYRRIKNTYCYQSQTDSSVGSLWHIHGTVDDLRNLGATLRVLKKGLPHEFKSDLERQLADAFHVVFVGYSMGDTFDVNPLFSSKPTCHYTKCSATFVQHTSGEVPVALSRVLRCFRDVSVVTADTTRFLGNLAKNTITTRISRRPYDWKDGFTKFSDTTNIDVIRPLLTCKICGSLGINTDIIDPFLYQMAVSSGIRYSERDFHLSLAEVCRMSGRKAEEKTHFQSVSDLLGYHYAHWEFHNALASVGTSEELLDCAVSAKTKLDWELFTQASLRGRILVLRYLRSSAKSKLTFIDRKEAERLLRLFYVLGNTPLGHVTHLNAPVTAQRNYLMISALLDGRNLEDTERQILNTYAEGASILGHVSAYRDIAIKHAFLARYHGEAQSYALAREYAEKSIKLAKAVGNVDGIKYGSVLKKYIK